MPLKLGGSHDGSVNLHGVRSGPVRGQKLCACAECLAHYMNDRPFQNLYTFRVVHAGCCTKSCSPYEESAQVGVAEGSLCRRLEP